MIIFYFHTMSHINVHWTVQVVYLLRLNSIRLGMKLHVNLLIEWNTDHSRQQWQFHDNFISQTAWQEEMGWVWLAIWLLEKVAWRGMVLQVYRMFVCMGRSHLAKRNLCQSLPARAWGIVAVGWSPMPLHGFAQGTFADAFKTLALKHLEGSTWHDTL